MLLIDFTSSKDLNGITVKLKAKKPVPLLRPSIIRASFFDLLMCLWVDRHPHYQAPSSVEWFGLGRRRKDRKENTCFDYSNCVKPLCGGMHRAYDGMAKNRTERAHDTH